MKFDRHSLLVTVICMSLVFNLSTAQVQGRELDRDNYYRAVNFCRRSGWPYRFDHQMSLSPDKLVLCFDGVISKDLDVSPANDLKDGGLFVVRSIGGYTPPAIALSDIVRDRHATVVVYDYCISACAGMFLVASDATYVLKGTLVAWHYPTGGELCTFLTAPRGDEPRKLQRGPCQQGGENGWPTIRQFFAQRAVSPPISFPPHSLYVRRVVRNLYKETGVFHDAMWTLNPRYYPSLFKTKIVYEAYPESQEEVDAMVTRLGLNMNNSIRVIYDP